VSDFQPTVVEPEAICRRLGIAEPTEDQLDRARDAIVDAKADLELVLNRSLFPETVIVEDLHPLGEDLDDWRTWRNHGHTFEDDYRVLDATATTGGTYTVTFSVGLDGRTESPIVRFVIAHAVESLRNDPDSGLGKRVPTSMGAGGQSVSFAAPQPGAVGSIPSLEQLKRRYHRPVIYKNNRPNVGIWPYAERW